MEGLHIPNGRQLNNKNMNTKQTKRKTLEMFEEQLDILIIRGISVEVEQAECLIKN